MIPPLLLSTLPPPVRVFRLRCADGHAGSFAVARPLATVIVKNRKRHRAVFWDIAGHGGFVAAGNAVYVERDNTALRCASLLATFLGRCSRKACFRCTWGGA